MFILKLALAAFLVSLNIFSFLLVKFQKNDRERKILKSIAVGSEPPPKPEQKPSMPNNDDQEKAQQALEVMEKKPDNPSLNVSDEDKFPKDEKKIKEEKAELLTKFSKRPVSDFKLIFCAILGGGLGIYISLFIFRYRLRDLMMMVLIPTILVVNIYIYLQIFTVWMIMPAAIIKLVM